MKALQYDNRFLTKIQRQKLSMNIAAIQETNNMPKNTIQVLSGEDSGSIYDSIERFFNQYRNAKTYGSLIKTGVNDTSIIEKRVNEIKLQPLDDVLITEEVNYITDEVSKLIKQNEILSSKYDVLVMNPPYMSSSSMNDVLKKFVNKEYPKSKSDMFATFMDMDHLLNDKALYAAINMHSWMFLSSFEKLRKHIVSSKQIDSMLHLGTRAFEEIGGEVVQTTAFVLRNNLMDDLPGTYIRLVDFNNSVLKSNKAKEAVANPEVTYRYTFDQNNLKDITGSPIAYWASDSILYAFKNAQPLGELLDVRQGLATANNDRFLRLWWEPIHTKINFNAKSSTDFSNSKKKWAPFNKGGARRQWYGNYDYLINWEYDGKEIKNFTDSNGKQRSVIRNPKYYFKESISWSAITSGGFSIRYIDEGSIFSNAGMAAFSYEDTKLEIALAILSSKISDYVFKIINPTLNLGSGDVASFPVIFDKTYKKKVLEIVENSIGISKNDWNSFETSWNFKKLPLITYQDNTSLIGESYNKWIEVTDESFYQIKENEEQLNRIFIDIYGLQNEMTSKVSERDITITKIYDEAKDIPDEIKGNQYILTKKDVLQQFISYAVGCMFGRYSLDEEGLVYAGGEFDASRYETYDVVEDNIIPITSDVYLEDDLVNRFVDVEAIYGEETLEDNLTFIAEALGQRKTESSRDTIHRYFLNDFFKDHAKMYSVTGSGRRPIYWKFTSGKENAFNCFIYMHRYDKTTISRIRTVYLHDVQQRLETRKIDLDQILNSDASTTELNKARKEMKTVEKQLAELVAYDEKLRHMADQQIEIDLDDGFNVNYPKFKGLVEKV